MDTLARALLAAASLARVRRPGRPGRAPLLGVGAVSWARPSTAGPTPWPSLHDLVLAEDIDGAPVSGGQEHLESVVNRHIERIR